MKKFLVLFAVVLLVAGMSIAQTTKTLNLNVTVSPYVELNMNYPSTLDFGAISPPQQGPGSGEDFQARGAGFWEWLYEFGYANCPYSLQISGGNLAGNSAPIFAQEEVGTGNWDRLVTALTFHFTSDLAGAMSAVQYNPTFIYPNPTTWDITTTRGVPHTGEIFLKPTLGVRFPAKTPDFGVTNTWDQSPDAGLYQAYVTITIAAI